MTPELIAFLRDATGRPFVWGEDDCSLWPCRWIRLRRGIDPAAHLRGTYADAASCLRLLRREGGLPALAARLAAAAGLDAIAAPRSGDVVCVPVLDDHFTHALGIQAGARVVVKGSPGVNGLVAAPVAAWRV